MVLLSTLSLGFPLIPIRIEGNDSEWSSSPLCYSVIQLCSPISCYLFFEIYRRSLALITSWLTRLNSKAGPILRYLRRSMSLRHQKFQIPGSPNDHHQYFPGCKISSLFNLTSVSLSPAPARTTVLHLPLVFSTSALLLFRL